MFVGHFIEQSTAPVPKLVNEALQEIMFSYICLFVVKRPSQQLWSCQDVADFYPKLGCHDI